MSFILDDTEVNAPVYERRTAHRVKLRKPRTRANLRSATPEKIRRILLHDPLIRARLAELLATPQQKVAAVKARKKYSLSERYFYDALKQIIHDELSEN